MPRTFSLEMLSCDVAEFLVDQRDQSCQSLLVARLPAYEQLAHRVRMLLIHSQLQPETVRVKIASLPLQVNAPGAGLRVSGANFPPF
jgi:hypothetical protein